MAIKNKIEKIGGVEAPRPEAEKPVLPEKKVEIEKPLMREAEKAPPAETEAEKPIVTTVVAPVTARPPKSETLVKIEKILEEDLEEFYFSMPPKQQRIFKEKGEETASKIERMVETGRAVGRKILHLIRAWLKLIPGVSRFFLEQEAKIKTDKVISVAEKKKME